MDPAVIPTQDKVPFKRHEAPGCQYALVASGTCPKTPKSRYLAGQLGFERLWRLPRWIFFQNFFKSQSSDVQTMDNCAYLNIFLFSLNSSNCQLCDITLVIFAGGAPKLALLSFLSRPHVLSMLCCVNNTGQSSRLADTNFEVVFEYHKNVSSFLHTRIVHQVYYICPNRQCYSLTALVGLNACLIP